MSMRPPTKSGHDWTASARSFPTVPIRPRMFKFDVSQFPILFLAVSGNMGPRELREFTEDQIQYRIERVPGVGQAEVQGGLIRQIQVNLELAKLRSLDLSVNQVVGLLQRENTNLPAGAVEEGRFDLLLRTRGQFQNLQQIQNLVLTTRGGVPVYLRDVAEIVDGSGEVLQLNRVNGRPGVGIRVQKQSGANTVEVADGVRTEIARIEQDFPNISITIMRDSSAFIQRSIATVEEHAVIGGLLAVFILLLFLRNVGSTLIVALAIPISLISTFGLLYFFGYTLNTVTLGGLALGVGRLVDDAIVVMENTFRHRGDGQVAKKTPLSSAARRLALPSLPPR